MSNLGLLVSQESLVKPHSGGCVGSVLILTGTWEAEAELFKFKSSLVYIVNLGKPE